MAKLLKHLEDSNLLCSFRWGGRFGEPAGGCSWLVGDAIPAFVDDFGDLIPKGGYPSGHATTTALLELAGAQVQPGAPR